MGNDIYFTIAHSFKGPRHVCHGSLLDSVDGLFIQQRLHHPPNYLSDHSGSSGSRRADSFMPFLTRLHTQLLNARLLLSSSSEATNLTFNGSTTDCVLPNETEIPSEAASWDKRALSLLR